MTEETAVLILESLVDIFWAITVVGVINFLALLMIASVLEKKN